MTGSRRTAAAARRAPLDLGITGGRVPTAPSTVYERRDGRLAARSDQLAVEEPLEIRLLTPGEHAPDGRPVASTLSITMRTPGHDFELVAGFLLSEGVVASPGELRRIAYCLDRDLVPEQRYNVVTAELAGAPRRTVLERHVVTSSACGVCGSASIESVRLAGHPELGSGPVVGVDLLASLPELLSAGQRGFAATGGLHGAALVAPDATVLALREDVGRHNAVDKVVGWALLEDRVPLADVMLIVSGRISFEIVQKALQAGIPIVAAVSAATSLAVRLATETGMTLVGFVRGDRCTVYAGRERIVFSPQHVSKPSS
ncbi:MAG: formate dehydrogenase family accessory protein FdhD [Acidimicrobiaceae bacterium]|jgi:FdhD protein|nr:formate dehydrogenase family accessory protein FdhD [Acidimicrobiaceae bacterium]